MATRYKPPGAELQKLMAVRMSEERFADLSQVVEDWKNVAIASGESDDVVKGINPTYVLRRALETFFDAELDEYGGRPKSDAERADRKRRIAEIVGKKKSAAAKK